MKIDGRTLSKEEKAFVRRMAVQRVWDGEKPGAVTASYGLGRKTIFGWLRKAEEQGLDALAPRPHTGRKRETPVVATTGQRQAISAISALTNRGAFWCHVYTGRFPLAAVDEPKSDRLLGRVTVAPYRFAGFRSWLSQ